MKTLGRGAMTVQPEFDVAVIGGGPAGGIAATRAAELGMAVILMARPRPRGALEGLAPRTVEALKNLGFARAAALSTAPAIRRVHWNGQESAANSEVLVERTGFDRALLDCVAEAGVTVVNGSAVRMKHDEAGWRIHTRETQGKTHICRARMIVEARGRRALSRGQAQICGPVTFSLARWYEGAELGKSFTAIASHCDGWSWLANLGDGRVSVQALTGFDNTPSGSRKHLMDQHGAIVGDILNQYRDDLGEHLTPLDEFFVRDASVALSNEPITQAMIRVGDAAASVDPLSGHGIFQAISSGLTAAPTLNTILNRPAQADLAMAFYGSRVKRRFIHQVKAGQEFYAEEKQWSGRPFWQERRDWLHREEIDHTVDEGNAPITLDRRGVVEEGFVVERDVLVTPANPDGVLMLDGVPMADLWREVKAPGTSLSEDQLARKFDVAPRQIEVALRWLREQSVTPL